MRGLITLVSDNHVDNYRLRNFGVCILWFDCKPSFQKYDFAKAPKDKT